MHEPGGRMSGQNEAVMDRNMAIEAVRVTEAAAIAASRWRGRGDEREADSAAVEAMRVQLNRLAIDGTVVIGEGERDDRKSVESGKSVSVRVDLGGRRSHKKNKAKQIHNEDQT